MEDNGVPLNKGMDRIWQKKIFLYGNERIQKDFDYLFRYRGLDIESIGVLCAETPWDKERRVDSLVVLCEKERDDCFEHCAAEFGMIYGQEYMYAKDFFPYYNPMFLERKGRKLAVWGTGICATQLWNTLDKKGFASEIDFYIDNANDKQIFKGKPVVSPMEIKDRRDIYIVVATSLYPWEIYRQLEDYGFERKKDYVYYDLVIKDYAALLERVCFAEKQYPYFCHRPFGYCDVIGEDLYFCCPDYLPISAGTMRGQPFMDCWNSYVARILRLSSLNGTFAFCNKQYCDLFDFSQKNSTIRDKKERNYEKEPLEYPNTLMVGIDYSCNLKCPSCRQEVCVATDEERKEMDRRAEDLLAHVVSHVKRLWMVGNGEVFFSRTYRNMLEDKRCKERTSISILSNGTLFDEENWKLIEKSYESVEIGISMDGIRDETIEKLRRGADAQRLKKNLEFLGNLRKNNKIEKLFISCVLQADNVAELYELLEYCKKSGVDKIQFLKLKNNGIYAYNGKKFDEMSIFDEHDCLKEKYRSYFTQELLLHPLADWFNNAESLGLEKKQRLDKYDTF